MFKEKKPSYTEDSITVLKGLEPIKKRPGMYTHTDHPTHIAQELIDNSVDEALAGFAKNIKVKVFADRSLEVEDDGRGIPIGLHPQEKISVAELVFTRLHAGGKFNKQQGSAYVFSGGLHGVGVSVTNALSSRLQVIIKREGAKWELLFEHGRLVTPLKKIDRLSLNDTGTIIRMYPDPQYFDDSSYDLSYLATLLRAKAVLLPGLKVSLEVENEQGQWHKTLWQYESGIKEYLEDRLFGQALLHPVILLENNLALENNKDFNQAEGVSVALAWPTEGEMVKESYVNMIATSSGGTHEIGLKQVLFNAVDKFVHLYHLLPRGVKLQSDDVFCNVSFILFLRLLDPQFQGQTKEKLSNRTATRLVNQLLQDPIDLWFNQHIEVGKAIAAKAIHAAERRIKSARKVEKRKTSSLAVLPGKLTECESEDIRENELFLVEGESAGGSAKLARNKYHQALLPLKGKVLNSYEVQQDQLFANREIHDIAVAIGVNPHSKSDSLDISGLRYGKIIILSDADVDGAHIQVLLLTLFYRHFPKLIEQGYIYVAQPPLFRVDVPAKGKQRSAKKYYVTDEIELAELQKRLMKEGLKEKDYSINRFKGLGEMQPQQLRDTAMDPDTRNLLRIQLDKNSQDAEDTLLLLMSKRQVVQRRYWIEQNGSEIEVDI